MVLIGFDKEKIKNEDDEWEETEYWKVKNTYGSNWGRGGYGRILMDKYKIPIKAYVPKFEN